MGWTMTETQFMAGTRGFSLPQKYQK